MFVGYVNEINGNLNLVCQSGSQRAMQPGWKLFSQHIWPGASWWSVATQICCRTTSRRRFYSSFMWERKRKRIIQIRPHLPKLSSQTKTLVVAFLFTAYVQVSTVRRFY